MDIGMYDNNNKINKNNNKNNNNNNNNNNKLINNSVFAGIGRDSIIFYSINLNEVRYIINGKIVTKEIPNRFFKSFKALSMYI
jgi:hypothetical protein